MRKDYKDDAGIIYRDMNTALVNILLFSDKETAEQYYDFLSKVEDSQISAEEYDMQIEGMFADAAYIDTIPEINPDTNVSYDDEINCYAFYAPFITQDTGEEALLVIPLVNEDDTVLDLYL